MFLLIPYRRLGAAAIAVCIIGICIAAEAASPEQLLELPIEQLMQYQVDSVSKYAQPIAEIPASITIVTAADIKTYGYRTLAEILNSMRGLYISYNRNYSFIGVRGFTIPGDYNTRVLLLVDGVRYNENVYNQVLLGNDFNIDVDLLERVEFVSGPTSAVYGSNAFLGVINVITKNGGAFNGVDVALQSGSYGTTKGRATYGATLDSGASWLVSASRYNQRGQDFYFSEFATPAQNNGVAHADDREQSTTLLAKYQQNNFAATLTHSERLKGVPTAPYQQVFNDRRTRSVDAMTNLGLEYRHTLAERLGFTGRLYGGHYTFLGNDIYAMPQAVENRDEAIGDWLGGEGQLMVTAFDRQKLLLGADYRRDLRIHQENFDVVPRQLYFSDNRRANTVGVYLQDEITLRPDLIFDAGARLDHTSMYDWVGSPRAGLIYRWTPATALKLLYGTAYRTPNAYELYFMPSYYALPENFSALKNERIRSEELAIEHAFADSQRLSFSLFKNDVADLIALQVNADGSHYYANAGAAMTRGMQVEWQAGWASGRHVKASYSWQQGRDDNTGKALRDAPRHLLKGNLSGPLSTAMNYGITLRVVSARDSRAGSVAGYGVLDMSLRSMLSQQVEVSASLYNVFNHRYYDPTWVELQQDALVQDTRNFRITVDYRL